MIICKIQEERLRARGTETEESIKKRLKHAQEDLDAGGCFGGFERKLGLKIGGFWSENMYFGRLGLKEKCLA